MESPQPKPVLEGREQEMFNDPEYKRLLQERSLTYLTKKDPKWFYSLYSGKVSEQGYLLDKNGKETNVLPSQSITEGLKEVTEAAKRSWEFKKSHGVSPK
ncbi:hypothetical protein A3A03_04040 [Candidatus Nomurabacteria bacterium RIFCSPLOWO2_01_FULL_40_18]|uniref:Uncharacterized protein n=1 Tax=Candidatus Nomurabacteria bacterium RIFCSPLOWO2_01_FULL_40_18 TaxID=1801773 RepID=A0A1F6XLP4_9BACT|nr:MAG: hypothetical protein A3A03_04040 [Candidatus Nomurabacteria bacterium RIFCSPLOWO2_01_FULL_40_18]